MIAVVDESSPYAAGGEIIYSVGAVLMDEAEHERLLVDLPVLLGRQRPFHWETDKGPRIRQRVVDEILHRPMTIVVAATAVLHAPRQNDARRMLLEDMVLPMLSRLGMTQLLIESRSSSENDRDTANIRTWYRQQRLHRQPTLSFVNKNTPSTWLADAVSGMWADAVRGRASYFEDLVAAGRLAQATWLA